MQASSNSQTLDTSCLSISAARGAHYREGLQREGIYSQVDGDGLPSWRVSASPYWLTPTEADFLDRLGPALLAFYQSLNRLYHHSLKTPGLGWVARYLDQGKPQTVIDFGRMRRIRDHLPAIIRPDLLATDSGWVASELDAVPGGFGVTAAFQRLYGEHAAVVGGATGVVDGLLRAVGDSARVAIVVSDESADYRPEMRYMARALSERGIPTATVSPTDVMFHEDGLTVMMPDGPARVDVLYRFFELFDLKNIPKSDLLLYAVKKETVWMTPPAKAFLEEKLAMALWHHPVLSRWWRDDVGARAAEQLDALFPRTWILDPTPVPAHATIAGFELGGRPIRDWRELADATQRERRLVIKPSGFSALAWGGRGVVVGHDQPADAWRNALEAALDAFPVTPHVLQTFYSARRDEVCYVDESSGDVRSMAGRTRLSPYYVVSGDQVTLAGALATTCPLDKKIIHGMKDAVLAPCAVQSTPEEGHRRE